MEVWKKKLTPEFLTWFNSTSKEYNFDHPYVACIFNKTCSGNFSFEIDVAKENFSQLEPMLIRYGKIKGEYTDYGEEEYTILFETDDIYKINNFLSLTQEIKIDKIKSNYKINVSLDEMRKCETDRECILVDKECCGCENEIINNKYKDLWENQFYCVLQTCVAELCEFNPIIICEENVCTKKDIMKCDVDNDCISGEEDCINEELAERLDYTITNKFNCKCKENKCTGALKIPLVINITFPTNNSIITANEVYINLTTNRTAICDYSTKIKKGDSTIETEFKEMNLTNKKNHSQIIGDLQNSGDYTVQLECRDNIGNKEKSSVNFLSRLSDYLDLSGRFVGESSGWAAHVLKTKLPILLNSGLFQYSNGPSAEYIQDLFINSKSLENSTSNGDLELPKVLIEVGTNYSRYLYKYRLLFSKAVNFTKENGGEWWMQILGDNYKIVDGSTNQNIILNKDFSDDNFILENEQPLKINDKIINGTYVKFNYGNIPTDSIIGMDIYFAMQPEKDYIAVGEFYDNPFFQNVRYWFKNYSEISGAEIYFGQTGF